jgi:signal peptidase I
VKADELKSKGLKSEPPAKAVPSLEERVRNEAVAWFWVVLVFLLVNGTLGQARVIPSGSMENTLLVGDHLIMSKVGYDAGIPFTNIHVPLWRQPRRQQIVIFKPPYAPKQTDLIKRVVGLPGDLLDIRDGAVFVNGRKLQENYTTGPTEVVPAWETPRGFQPLRYPYRVPANSYFVMGDNRGNSYDSRFWGPVPREYIIGTPVAIYMSVEGAEDSWNGNIANRFLAYAGALFHPSRIRWKRLFEAPR